jgi:tRNA dimethylallyltransferase
MDIGTAKPTPAEQAEIPHHCIDMVEPDGDYTAALFQADALAAIEDISARDKMPIISGGTGLYVDGVLYNFSFLDTGDRDQREQLNLLSIDELVTLAQDRGYSLVGVDQRNKRRLIRVIESAGRQPTRQPLRPHTLLVGLRVSRSQLRQNIEQRVELMFKRGLRREVETIAERYGWDCEGMQGIGYQEFIPWHEGKISMQQVKRQVISNTLHLAKRQRTWFKRNQDIVWCETVEQAKDEIAHFIAAEQA